jgi:GT2 family glycosyltransferase
MTAFNPLNHPALFRAPARLDADGGGVAHAPFLFFLLSVLRPRVLVELGTVAGDRYTVFCQAVEADQLATRCYAISPWAGTAAALAQLRAYHDPRYGAFSRLLPAEPAATLCQFAEQTVELLSLEDGARNLETLEAWLPKLSQRALVLCPEIQGVARDLWANLKQRFAHFEFIHAGGLGLLAPGGADALTEPELAALFSLPAAEAERVRAFFAQASQALVTDNALRPAFEQHLADLQREAQNVREQSNWREKRLQRLQAQLAQREQVIQQMNENYAEVVNSDAWWMINRYWAVRRVVIPPGSRRERGLKLSVRLARILGQLGLGGAAFKVTSRLRRRFKPVDVESWVDERTLKLVMTRPPIALPELNLPVVESLAERTPVLPDCTVSVVIPTWNAGPEFAVLLASLTSQQGCERIEIIVVDSGSTDDTVQLARDYGVRVIEIPSAEFSHSHARNLGGQAATGEYVLFMVQDALPASPLWARDLVAALRQQHAVAASSVEAPREDADLLARVLNQAHYHFLGAAESDRLLNQPVSADYNEVRRNSQLCNVACLLERKTFAQYQFRGNYAEDLDLGMRLTRDGHRLLLLNSVKVVHSHNRPAYYHLKRGYVDSAAMAELFSDFPKPPAVALGQLGQESLAVFQLLEQLFAQQQESLAKPQPIGEFASAFLQALESLYANPAAALAQPFAAERDLYTAFLAKLAALPSLPASGQLTASPFAGAVRDLLEYTLEYLKGIHEVMEVDLFESLRQCLGKVHALQLGSFLASARTSADWPVWLDAELRKGV